jgi:hypothetical protein
METYQILALLALVPACVYFNWRSGYKAGIYDGVNSALAYLETTGAISISLVNGKEVVTINTATNENK